VRVRAVVGGPVRTLEQPAGNWFPTDWLPGRPRATGHGRPRREPRRARAPDRRGPARPYAATPARESAARISPDGRWVAYQSDEGGRVEVYVDAFPTPGRRLRVSGGGGVHPAWAGDGRELFYWEGDRLVAARLATAAGGAAPAVVSRTPLFRARYPDALIAMYDVSPDGQRFVLAAGAEPPDRLVVVGDALTKKP
jgi:hypothetical protein